MSKAKEEQRRRINQLLHWHEVMVRLWAGKEINAINTGVRKDATYAKGRIEGMNFAIEAFLQLEGVDFEFYNFRLAPDVTRVKAGDFGFIDHHRIYGAFV